MICAGLAPGARILLRQHEGEGLLRTLVAPDALLEQRQLAQFYDALKVPERAGSLLLGAGCGAVPARLPAGPPACLPARLSAQLPEC